MISLTVVIITLAIVFGGFWLLFKFNKGEELKKDYRDKYTGPHTPHSGKRGA